MFLKTLAIFALTTAALSAQVAQPKLNGLELRKGHMIQQALTQAQANFDQANKALTQAQAMKISPGSAERTVEQQNQAKARQKQEQLRVTQLQNQMADWESSTLSVHAADPAKYKVDWTQGQIVAK